MEERSVDVAVIGSGTAGLNAIGQIRRAGKSFVLINGGEPGTICARVGCMPSKAMIHGGGGLSPPDAAGQIRRGRIPGADLRRQTGHGTRPRPAGHLRRPGARQLHRQHAPGPLSPGLRQIPRTHPAGGGGTAHPRPARGHRHRLAAPGAPRPGRPSASGYSPPTTSSS